MASDEPTRLSVETRRPSQKVIAALEGLLQEARDGKLRAIGYICVMEGWRNGRALVAEDCREVMIVASQIHSLAEEAREMMSLTEEPDELPELKRDPAQRGTPAFPCEDCGQTEHGNCLDDGWYRCARCGYPSK